MTTSAQPHLPLRHRMCALVLAWQVFFVGLLAASPVLHDCAHHDAGEEHHACAVALFLQGLVPLDAPPATLAAPSAYRAQQCPLPPPAVRAAGQVRLPPVCGPPRA